MKLSLLSAADKEPKKRAKSTVISAYPTEHEEQVALVKWFRLTHKGVRIFAVPNAAARSFELAAYLRSEGMTKGVPDLHIPAWRMVIEMKRQKGNGSVTSPEQHNWKDYYEAIGWTHFFGEGAADAIEKIESWSRDQ